MRTRCDPGAAVAVVVAAGVAIGGPRRRGMNYCRPPVEAATSRVTDAVRGALRGRDTVVAQALVVDVVERPQALSAVAPEPTVVEALAFLILLIGLIVMMTVISVTAVTTVTTVISVTTVMTVMLVKMTLIAMVAITDLTR